MDPCLHRTFILPTSGILILLYHDNPTTVKTPLLPERRGHEYLRFEAFERHMQFMDLTAVLRTIFEQLDHERPVLRDLIGL